MTFRGRESVNRNLVSSMTKPSISVFQNEKNVRGRGFSIEMKHLMRIKESKLIEFGISRRYPSHIFYENSSETSSASCFSH